MTELLKAPVPVQSAAPSVPVISVHQVSKRFVIRKDKSIKERVVNFGRSQSNRDEFWGLRDVSLEIESGTTVGLIGPNGSGKSTLLKLIGGIMRPTSGTIERRGRLAALIELGAGFHPDLTGRENVFLNCAILGLTRAQTEEHFDAIVEFSGIPDFIDTQVKFYSSGMYIRLAFAVAVHVDPDVLLVDEVLAVGDEPFQRKCLDRIHAFQQEGRTIVFVSHALDQVAELCDRVVVLENGVVQVDGPPREALRHLRADFEVTRSRDRERERGRDAVAGGATRARIAAVQLGDVQAGERVVFVAGSDLSVHVTVSPDEPLVDWILGVGIDGPSGQVLFGTNTKLMGQPMPDCRTTTTFTITIRGVWLGEGTYTVHAAIAEGSGVEVDRMREAATLVVESDGTAIGPVYASAILSAD